MGFFCFSFGVFFVCTFTRDTEEMKRERSSTITLLIKKCNRVAISGLLGERNWRQESQRLKAQFCPFMCCHHVFLPAVQIMQSISTSKTEPGDFLLSQMYQGLGPGKCFSFSLSYGRETPNKTTLKTSLISRNASL